MQTAWHFLPQLLEKSVFRRSDNQSVVQTLNKQKGDGVKSSQLYSLKWDLWNLAIANNFNLKAPHIAGQNNCLADSQSLNMLCQTEWSLNSQTAQKDFSNVYGTTDTFLCDIPKHQDNSILH